MTGNEIMTEIFGWAGILCITVGGFMVHPVVGMSILGIILLLIAVGYHRSEKEKRKEGRKS